MNVLVILIPVSLALGALGLIAFLWSLRDRQYEDLDGAAWRILLEDEGDDGRDRAGNRPGASRERAR